MIRLVFAALFGLIFFLSLCKVEANVTINCTDPLIVNEGDDLTCLCEAKGGNPPADVTWEKDGVSEPGGSGMEQKILTRVNVRGADSGTYTCVAKGHTLTNNKSIDVKVRPNAESVPNITSFTITPGPEAKKVSITCISKGVPSPDNTIIRNGTKISAEKTTTKISTEKTSTTYTIDFVTSGDAGIYTCIANNKNGNDSATLNLTVQGQTAQPAKPTSKATTAKGCNGTANAAANSEDGGTVVWNIMVSLLSGIIIGFLLSHIVSCSRRRWFKNKKRQPNLEAQKTDVDTTYQELDLSKMNSNKEDNYQSLRVNAASNNGSNDEESTYNELSETRDVENNYQSLT